MTYFNVVTAIDTHENALKLLQSCVRGKLAASGQVIGPVSAAWWHDGEYEEGEEWVVVLKTAGDRREELERHLLEVHPWGAGAEVSMVEIDGTERYLGWIRRTTEK